MSRRRPPSRATPRVSRRRPPRAAPPVSPTRPARVAAPCGTGPLVPRGVATHAGSPCGMALSTAEGARRTAFHAAGASGMGRRGPKPMPQVPPAWSDGAGRHPGEGEPMPKASPARPPDLRARGPSAYCQKTVAPAPRTCIMAIHAGVAELADAYGSGPYEGSLMKVQVLSPAPSHFQSPSGLFFCAGVSGPRRPPLTDRVRNRSATRQDIVKYFLKISSYLQCFCAY